MFSNVCALEFASIFRVRFNPPTALLPTELTWLVVRRPVRQPLATPTCQQSLYRPVRDLLHAYTPVLYTCRPVSLTGQVMAENTGMPIATVLVSQRRST